MRRKASIILVVLFGWAATTVPAWTQMQSPVTKEAPVPYWSYRWAEQAGGTTQVWRRPASDPKSGWIPAGVVPGAVSDIAATAADPALALALTKGKLYRSRDAGQTWAALPDLPDWPTAVALGQQTAGVTYLGTLTAGVFRSVDAGDTWQALSPDLGLLPGTFLEVTALEVYPGDEGTVYAATGYWLGTTEEQFSPLGVFVSRDAGATWQLLEEASLSSPMITSLTPSPGKPLAVGIGSEAPAP
jgi:hypothetical protein